VPVKIPVHLPSELLRQRPDIRAAERRLAAATAQIGVATADLFPRFSLSALLGLQSINLSDLVTSGSRYWSIGPTLNLSLFDGGKARAEIEIRKAQRDSALALYEKTVLGAIADVENSLTSFSHEKEARQSLVEAVASGKKALAIADGLYQSGLTDFLHVLQSEHALYQSQDQLVQSNQRLALDVVAIFKALGGGWKLKEAPVSPPRSVGAKNSKQQNRQ
jgi:NodT family efflux transporter outer membrane factor (OMF) lipoprotein